MFGVSNVGELLAIAENVAGLLEMRLFAGAKVEAKNQLAAERREVRPEIDFDYLRAVVAGSIGAIRRNYCLLLHVGDHRDGVKRRRPLDKMTQKSQ